ncbi:MAG: ATP synthase F1 subunit delta [Deltaproteobacteria bacterium]|nr:ATP synthase F1 subunit delta [Deltaproteobacteria bacterium]
MSESAIARRYAKAFIDIAREEGAVTPYRLELENFSAATEVSADLLKILSNRFLPASQRLSVIDEVGGKLSLSPAVVRFLKFLVKKRRIGLFKLVANAYRHQAFVLENKEEAFVTTASPLSPAAYDEIRKTLEGRTKKNMLVHQEIDAKVLGGIRVRVGNEVYDGTIRTQLDKMSGEMTKGIF